MEAPRNSRSSKGGTLRLVPQPRMAYTPVAAARWMSAMVARSKVADSRSPSSSVCCAGIPGAGKTVSWGGGVMVMGLSLLVRRRVVGAEVVEVPCRSVALEVRRVVGAAGGGEQFPELVEVLGFHRFLDAVRTERSDRSLDVDPGFVNRVPKGVAGVAADHEPAGLGHEGGHVPDVAAYHDVHALHGDPAPGAGIAVDHHESAVAGGRSRLGGIPVHVHFSGHDVLGESDAGIAGDGHLALLVHSGGVVAGVAVDGDADVGAAAHRGAVLAFRVGDGPGLPVGGVMKGLVEVTDRAAGQVDAEGLQRCFNIFGACQ